MVIHFIFYVQINDICLADIPFSCNNFAEKEIMKREIQKNEVISCYIVKVDQLNFLKRIYTSSMLKTHLSVCHRMSFIFCLPLNSKTKILCIYHIISFLSFVLH